MTQQGAGTAAAIAVWLKARGVAERALHGATSGCATPVAGAHQDAPRVVSNAPAAPASASNVIAAPSTPPSTQLLLGFAMEAGGKVVRLQTWLQSAMFSRLKDDTAFATATCLMHVNSHHNHCWAFSNILLVLQKLQSVLDAASRAASSQVLRTALGASTASAAQLSPAEASNAVAAGALPATPTSQPMGACAELPAQRSGPDTKRVGTSALPGEHTATSESSKQIAVSLTVVPSLISHDGSGDACMAAHRKDGPGETHAHANAVSVAVGLTVVQLAEQLPCAADADVHMAVEDEAVPLRIEALPAVAMDDRVEHVSVNIEATDTAVTEADSHEQNTVTSLTPSVAVRLILQPGANAPIQQAADGDGDAVMQDIAACRSLAVQGAQQHVQVELRQMPKHASEASAPTQPQQLVSVKLLAKKQDNDDVTQQAAEQQRQAALLAAELLSKSVKTSVLDKYDAVYASKSKWSTAYDRKWDTPPQAWDICDHLSNQDAALLRELLLACQRLGSCAPALYIGKVRCAAA